MNRNVKYKWSVSTFGVTAFAWRPSKDLVIVDNCPVPRELADEIMQALLPA